MKMTWLVEDTNIGTTTSIKYRYKYNHKYRYRHSHYCLKDLAVDKGFVEDVGSGNEVPWLEHAHLYHIMRVDIEMENFTIFVFSPFLIQNDQIASGTHIYAKCPHLVSENVMEPLQCIFGQAIGGPDIWDEMCADVCDNIWSA